MTPRQHSREELERTIRSALEFVPDLPDAMPYNDAHAALTDLLEQAADAVEQVGRCARECQAWEAETHRLERELCGLQALAVNAAMVAGNDRDEGLEALWALQDAVLGKKAVHDT